MPWTSCTTRIRSMKASARGPTDPLQGSLFRIPATLRAWGHPRVRSAIKFGLPTEGSLGMTTGEGALFAITKSIDNENEFLARREKTTKCLNAITILGGGSRPT